MTSSSAEFLGKQTCGPVSALTLLKRQRQETSHLSLLQGGVLPLTLGITEIAGSAGAGKTQIGLGLCVSCVQANDSCPRKALYVSVGEGTTQPKIAQRLQQMALSKNTSMDNVLQRILTRFIRNEEDLMNFIANELESTITSERLGVVVLDSIAGVYRGESHDYAKRSSDFFRIAQHLKRLSDVYQIPVVVINQVTTSLKKDKIVPALGLSWAACVNTSYMLSRQENVVVPLEQQQQQQQQGDGKQQSTVFVRRISLVRSSSLPPCSIAFRIQASGAVAIEN